MTKSQHTPPHIYIEDTWYMITASIYQKLPILRPESHKEFLRDHLKTLITEFHLQLKAWVILDNHYHLLTKNYEAEKMVEFFRRLHGRVAFELNGHDHIRGRQVWHNFWDTCIRNEAEYWRHFNYIHHNPIKHGYVKDMQAWKFSSYDYYLRSKGADWLADVFRQYPIVDFTNIKDDFHSPG